MTTPVVVTGAAGFIGSHVTRALVEQGASVIATDVRTTLPEPVLSGLDTSRVSYVSGDLRREETLDDLVEAAGERANVVHAAALLRYSEMAGALGQGAPSFPGALEVFDVNAMATWRLCSKFATAGRLARFVYVSTRSVFGSLEVDGDTIAETSPPSPIGIYGSSKTAAEFGVLAFRDVFALDLVVARVTGVFGPWQGGVSWIGKAVDGVIAGTGYRTSTGGDDRYEFTYVKDTARGLVELVNAERLSYPIYHVSSGSIHSLGEVAQAFHAAEPDAVVEFGAGSQPGMRTRLPLGRLSNNRRSGLPAPMGLECGDRRLPGSRADGFVRCRGIRGPDRAGRPRPGAAGRGRGMNHSLTWRQRLSFGYIGAIYVWAAIIVIFAIATPHQFLETYTIRAVVNNYSITGLAALAVLVPMAAGTFDASIGGNISLSGVICAYLLIHTGLSIPEVVLLSLASGLALGLVNVLVVVVLGIPSLIGTLATWLIADSLSVAISDNATLSSPRISGAFSRYLSNANWSGFAIPIVFVLVIAVIMGITLSRTVSGRYTFAVGFSLTASKLAGIRVKAIQSGALLCSGLVGAIAGVVLAAHVSSATPAIGDSYLLPAFAAVFVGATQFSTKRFNATGTVIAVFMLGTGEYGLLVLGAPQWTPGVFQGVALVAAIGLTHLYDPGRSTRRRRAKAAGVGACRRPLCRRPCRRRSVGVPGAGGPLARRYRARRGLDAPVGPGLAERGVERAGRDRGALQDLSRATGPHRRQHGRSSRRDSRAPGPERLGEVDAHQDPGRHLPTRFGRSRSCSRPGPAVRLAS